MLPFGGSTVTRRTSGAARLYLSPSRWAACDVKTGAIHQGALHFPARREHEAQRSGDGACSRAGRRSGRLYEGTDVLNRGMDVDRTSAVTDSPARTSATESASAARSRACRRPHRQSQPRLDVLR